MVTPWPSSLLGCEVLFHMKLLHRNKSEESLVHLSGWSLMQGSSGLCQAPVTDVKAGFP